LSAMYLFSSCCGKPKLEMSPLRKQGSTAKKLDSCFRRNDKRCFRNSNYLVKLAGEGIQIPLQFSTKPLCEMNL